jgi:hypothetical protein
MKSTINRKNPYATNRGGRIEAPTRPAANDPKATVKRGDDLRK